MSTWTPEELDRFTRADELRIAGRREDGTLHKLVIIWMVTHEGNLYVRSVNGADAAWFRGTQETHTGRVTSGAIDRDVTFTHVGDLNNILDKAYAKKYPTWKSAVDSINSPAARATTLRVDPAQP